MPKDNKLNSLVNEAVWLQRRVRQQEHQLAEMKASIKKQARESFPGPNDVCIEADEGVCVVNCLEVRLPE